MSATPPELLISVGAVIRQWREQHGWSLAELADRSGMARAHISDIERGRIHNPTLETLEKLAPALGISVWDVHTRRLPDPAQKPKTGTPGPTSGLAHPAHALPRKHGGSTLDRIERKLLDAHLPPAIEALALKAAEQAVDNVITTHKLSAPSDDPTSASQE